jgi:hypothetical protein
VVSEEGLWWRVVVVVGVMVVMVMMKVVEGSGDVE